MYEETEMTRNTASDLSKRGYAAILLGVAIGGFVGFGCFFFPSLAIFMRPVLAEFGWGRTELSLVFSASLLGCAFGGPVCGHFIDRFGVRRAAFTSALLLGLLIFVLSSVHGSVLLIASLTFAIGFCGAATTSLGYVSILPQWFDKRLGTAIAVATVGYGLGQSVWPIVSQELISTTDWRTGYRILSVFPVVGGAIAMLLLRERRPATRGANQDEPGLTVSEGIRTRHLWIMTAVFFLVASSSLAFQSQIPLLISDRGFTVAEAAQGPAVVGLGFLVSRLLCGMLVDRFPATIISCLFFSLSGVGFLFFETTNSLAILKIACLLIGFAIGTEQDMMAYMVRRYLGMRSFGTFFGFNMATFCLGGVVVPPLLGLYYDHYRNYSLPLAVMAGCMFAAAILVATLGRYRYATQPSAAGVERTRASALSLPVD